VELLDVLGRRALEQGTPWLLIALVLTVVLVGLYAREERRRARAAAFFIALHVILLPIAVGIELADREGLRALQLVMDIMAVLAYVGMGGLVLFTVILPRVRLRVPRIVQDVTMAAAAVVGILAMASRAGFNLSGLIATSAVLTAVIGFAFQDTLGNVIGGLALQTDNSLAVGAWIKVGDVTGQVAEIRWRYTAIHTRNGEVVLIPNGVLMKSTVMVLARGFNPGRWRRIVTFRVDFRTQPSDVIETVESALRAAQLPGVVEDPQPSCVLMDIGESQCLYAARVWTTDPRADDPVDSAVRTRIYFALQRARIRLSMPAQAVFLTQENHEREEEKTREQLDRQLEALRKVEILRSLSEDDLRGLAAELRYAPFTAGEVLTRQGNIANWLYLIVEGTVSVRVKNEQTGQEREVNRFGAGNFFGEMSLLTGEPRQATVVAVTDVECYRLGAEPFRRLCQTRPEAAEDFAEVLAERRVALDAAREGLATAARARTHDQTKNALLGKIRDFLGLEED
jgi:small-conductance mechanosensitive channel/CRP-like cAMP-binding protein